MPAAPSLLIVPYRSKTGKLYSQIPTSGAGDFTVTRDTTARRFNSAGLIESVASGIPRLDYYTSGGTAGCPALLVEPAATNLAFQSANFLTTWVLLSGTISTGSTAAFTAPDGTTSADLFTESTDVSATNHQISQSISTAVVSGTSYTLSCFFKPTAANRSARLSLSSALFSGSPQAFFDVTSGIVGTTTDCTARIENYGSGWYRCIMTAICDTAGTASVFVSSASGNTRDYIGNGSASLYLWGAQLETGSVATSYIPTTTGTASRSADVISVSGAVSGSIGQTEGVLYIECESNDGVDDVFFINRSVSNGIVLYKNANNAYLGRIHHSSATITFQSGNNVSGMVKIAIAYKSGDSTMYLNGSRVGTLNTNAITFGAALNSVVVNKEAFISGAKPSRIRAVALYNTRLTDAELATLTTP